MRASLLMAVALTAVVACDMPNEAAFRFDLSQDYYETGGLGEIGRKFRREAPFFVDLADESALSPDARARLEAQAAWVADYPSMRLLVVSMGPAEGGMVPASDPSHRRADTVVRYLIAQGVAPDMIRARVLPVGPIGNDFDPLQRVTTFVEEGMNTTSSGLPAAVGGLDTQRDKIFVPGQDASNVGVPIGGSGNPPVPGAGVDGPVAEAPVAEPTASGSTSDGPASGGPTPDAPVASGPAPSEPGGKNAAKREANSGRGNGDEDGDPGNSGGRNQGGDEVGQEV